MEVNLIKFLYLVIGILLFSTGTCQTVFEVDSGQTIHIGKNLQYYIDSKRNKSVDSVIGKPFLECKSEIFNIGNNFDNIWIRFSLKSKTENKIYLDVKAPLLEDLEIYKIVDSSKQSLLFLGGFNKPFRNRPIHIESWLFNIYLEKGKVSTFYIKVHSGFPLQIPIEVSSKDDYLVNNVTDDLFWGLYIGVVVFAFVYNLFVYTSVKERRYLYYILYILGSSTFYLGLQGFSFMFIWPNKPSFNEHLGIVICLTNIIITLFAMNFLRITKKQKAQYYVGCTLIISFASITLINLLGHYGIANSLAQLFSLICCLFFIYTGFLSLKRGIHDAKFFLIAWTLFLMFVFVFILASNNVIESNFFTTRCIFFGHMTEVLLLSFALADRINTLKKENIRFQQELLNTQLEIQEQTFKTISQELHDNIGQILAVAKLNLNTLDSGTKAEVAVKIDNAKDLLTQAIQDLRDLSKTLNTDVISVAGLAGAIKMELHLLQKTGAIDTKFEINGEVKKLDSQKELIIFRIIQESIHNIIKHSRASQASIAMNYDENEIRLIVADNGQGFSFQKNNSSGSGIRNIESRCKLIKAKFNLETNIGMGTVLTVTIPVNVNTRDVSKKTVESF